LFSDVFVIPTYTFRRNQDFPDATGYAIKSGEEQRREMLKSLLAILAILGVVALFFHRYDSLSLVESAPSPATLLARRLGGL
jgi:hypothetical protein